MYPDVQLSEYVSRDSTVWSINFIIEEMIMEHSVLKSSTPNNPTHWFMKCKTDGRFSQPREFLIRKNRVVIYFISDIAGYVLKINLSRGEGLKKMSTIAVFLQKMKSSRKYFVYYGKPWNDKNYWYPHVLFFWAFDLEFFCHLDTL